ncbi:hypothetical protein FBY34_8806 [Streptomyces sp. SLBN-115]|nr:hypothetical protein FBY34_8806 [Streptomyces sp. SLBN-115]
MEAEDGKQEKFPRRRRVPVRLSTSMVMRSPRSVAVEPGAVDVLDLRADGYGHFQVADRGTGRREPEHRLGSGGR